MDLSIPGQIAALRRMTVAELQERWFQLCGEPIRSRNRDYLWKRLAWRIQELRYGGLSDRAEQRIEELSSDGFVRGGTPTKTVAALAPQTPRPRRDARLPTQGTVISKQYKGRELRVVVREVGLELDSVMYPTATALAKAITGSRSINGNLFLGITKRKRS